MKNLVSLFLYLIVIISWPLTGQVITDRSEMVTTQFVSDSGNIVSFNVTVSGKSYVIIKDLSLSEEYKFETGSRRVFLTDKLGLIFNVAKKELYHVDFKNRHLDTITDVNDVEFLQGENKVVFKNYKTNTLNIMDLPTRKFIKMEDISFFSLSPDLKRLVGIKRNGEGILMDLKTNKKHSLAVFDLQNSRLKKIVFSKSNAEFYLVANTNKDIGVYAFRKNAFSRVGSYPILNEIEKTVIDTLFQSVRLLKDNQLVIGVKPLVISRKDDAADVHIWRGSQKGFTPNLEFQKNAANQIALVNLKTGQWLSLADSKVNMIFKIDDRDQIYSFDMFENDSLSRLDPIISVYKHETNDKRNKILKAVSSKKSNIVSYKNFESLVYFLNNNWYYYDDTQGKSFLITKDMKDDFYSKVITYSNETTNDPVALPLEWENRGLLLTSDKDIWFFDYKRKTMVQRTNGGLNGKKYQISAANYDLFNEIWNWSAIPRNTENYSDIILNWSSNMYSVQGLSLLTERGKLVDLVKDNALYSQIKRSKNHIIYIKEKANSAPKIYLYDIHKGTESLIYESNEYDTDAEKIVSEYICWEKQNGQLAGGILRFPKNYIPGSSKKYPVVVYVYDKKYKLQHNYSAPEAFSVSRINFRPFIADDYFVLEPDIYYKVGQTGDSALESVTEVIDTLSEKYPLDTSRMGIYGHSFGGYETNYIITQTNLFKAAVSSAGVADVVSEYFNYSKYSLLPNFWRYENHQWRLGKNFYQDKDMYLKNSPLYNAENVITPLLLITGNKDYVVNWQQSLLMFNALKKLKKTVNLLIYEEEGHHIQKYKNQKDVSMKVKQWFDYYLKDKEIPEWVD